MLEGFMSSNEEKNDILQDMATEPIITECAEDFILPDYLPEIRKLIRVDALPVSSGHYVGGEEVEWAGHIAYTLLYTDSEGKLTAVPLRTDYSYKAPVKEGTPYAIIYQESAEQVKCHPAGPRKVSLRCRLYARPHLYTKKDAQEPIEALLPQEMPIEKLPYITETANVFSVFSEEHNEEVSFTLDGFSEEALQIKTVDASVMTESAKCENGKIVCRGYIHVELLADDGASLLPQTKKIPFETELLEDGIRAGDSALLYGHILSLESEVRGRENGAEACVYLSYSLAAEAWRNTPITLYTDAYAQGFSLMLTSKPQKITRFVGAFSSNFTLSCDGNAECEENATYAVLSAKLLPQSSSLSLSGNKAIVAGDMKASVLSECIVGEGSKRIEENNFIFPYRLECDFSTVFSPEDEGIFTLTPLFASAKREGEALSVVGEVGLTVKVLRKETVALPEKIDADTLPASDGKDSIRIYYPTAKDSLWSVGKKYNVPLASLLASNGISEEDAKEPSNPKSLDGYLWLLVDAL
ncbi:MAG: DUF3794 domain-containing protein [Clostridia bacterium]|nr:DUF3794 domain-containing protein [Clostridia bacterium]